MQMCGALIGMPRQEKIKKVLDEKAKPFAELEILVELVASVTKETKIAFPRRRVLGLI